VTAPRTDLRISPAGAAVAAIPAYLEQVYWWAYIHPRGVRLFEQQWLTNLILFGNFARLRDAALDDLGAPMQGRTLQVACVYGDLTPRLSLRIGAVGSLDVIDVLPIQLRNLRRKLLPAAPVALYQRDSARLGFDTASYDRALVFFLLHEQPESVRRRTLAEVIRVVKPGGRIVLVDYHRPVRRHPLRPLVEKVLRRLEPYALDLWTNELAHYIPAAASFAGLRKETYFGGLYQKVTLVR
jgi:ubiquinone/menaquinone biosynthesis C-methylase UbiE